MEKAYSRSDRLLRKKFFQYLLPTMITYAALSLNEFVDSMLVSNLLDSDAMAVYAANKKDQNAYMDILARIYKGNVEIDFRSLGPLFDPFEDADEDIKENIRLLRGVASKIENEYILGMNSTRITIEAA